MAQQNGVPMNNSPQSDDNLTSLILALVNMRLDDELTHDEVMELLEIIMENGAL